MTNQTNSKSVSFNHITSLLATHLGKVEPVTNETNLDVCVLILDADIEDGDIEDGEWSLEELDRLLGEKDESVSGLADAKPLTEDRITDIVRDLYDWAGIGDVQRAVWYCYDANQIEQKDDVFLEGFCCDGMMELHIEIEDGTAHIYTESCNPYRSEDEVLGSLRDALVDASHVLHREAIGNIGFDTLLREDPDGDCYIMTLDDVKESVKKYMSEYDVDEDAPFTYWFSNCLWNSSFYLGSWSGCVEDADKIAEALGYDCAEDLDAELAEDIGENEDECEDECEECAE